MDYDDNDFQSKNHQLAGESSEKFPPVIRPYALPKFDFDDNLHGSLRFDSLVESEVFLGIENNEDSQWIEDFSRGSGGIQFTSNAAEPCSISLHNNVWSEATSSESVEMLLKSVGQEDLIVAKTRAKSDACDELGCIVKQMEPDSNQNSNIASVVEDLTKPTVPPVQFPEKSGLDDDGDRQLSQIEDISYSRGDASGDQGSRDLRTIDVEIKSSISERSPPIDKFDGNSSNEIKVDNAVKESSDNRIREISPSETEVNNVVTTAPTIIGKDDGLDNKEASDNVIQTAGTDLEILRTYKGEHHEKKDVIETDEIHGQVSSAEVVENGVSGVDNARLSPMECVKGESANQTNLCSVGEPSVIPKEDSDMAIRHQSSIDTHGEPLVVIEDDSADNRCEVEVSNGSPLDKGISVKAVSSPLSIQDNKGSEDKVDGKCSSYGVVNRSSSELCGETNAEDHVSSSMAAENIQMCENNVSGQRTVTDVDKYVPAEQEKDIVLSSVDIDVDGINDQCVIISSLGERSGGEQAISKLEPDSTGGNESANAVSLPSGSDINKDADCVKVEASPLSTVPTCSDTAKETAARSSVKAGLYDLKAVPETTSGATSVSEPERGSPISAGQMLGKPVNQTVDASDSGNQIESQSLLIGEVTQECIKDKDATLPVCDSTTETRESVEDQMKGKGSNVNEHVNVNVSDQTMDVEMPGPKLSTTVEPLQDTGHNFQKEVVMASKDIKVGQIPVPDDDVEREGIADLDKPASGSPTVIRSVQSSYDEKNKEGTKTILNQRSSVSEDKKQSASTYLNKTDPSKGDGNFSFEVPPMTVTPQKSSRKRHASSAVEATKAMPTVDASTSGGLGQLDPTVATDISHRSPVVAYVPVKLSGSKGNTERKARRASGKAPAKERSTKRNSAKESASLKSDRGDKMTSVSLSPSSFSQPVQSNEIQRIGNMDSSLLKPFMPVTSTASLPDLNSSISQAAVFHQPFTDLQQVQLRAQIFVYGALIQGTVPDEAYMISAFGGPDGGRSMWENPYRSFIERLHGHKSHLNSPEPRSGARPSEPSVKHSAVQSKVLSTPIGRGSSNSTPAIASPIVPFSSPLWTMPAPGGALQPSSMPRGPVVDLQRSLSPLHAHQSPGIRNFIGHSPSWLSQAPYGTPWVASQNFTLDTSGRLSVQFPVAESVQPTPIKETSVHTSAMRPTGLPAQNVGSSSILAGSPMLSEKIISASGSQPPSDAKARKRKKNSTSVTTVQHALPPQPLTESALASVVASPLSTSVAFTTPVVFVSKGPTENAVTSITPMLADFRKRDQTLEQKSILSEETLGKVKDAKVEAEDAAASAASAVSHSQQVWDQLEKQKNARLLPDVETKLASSAVAVAAAAAVAKAAAAAAKVASNAALQAKLIADEAVASTNISQINVNLSKATPTSIVKGDGTSSSASVLGIAKETARKNVEAASAAAIRAENMDAIVKAAELAAEAVSQAGKIVAMSDPMPLSELLAAGPEGYWKAASPELILRSNDTNLENRNISSGKEGPNSFARHLKEVPSENKETYIVSHGKPPAPGDRFSGDQNRLIEGLPGSGAIMMKEPRVRKGRKASTLVKTFGVVPESGNESKASIAQNEPEKEETSKENNIKEHSLVEVYKDGNGFKAAWFPAKVISMKDGKAHVEFIELALDEGSEKLKEWVPLESNGDEPPKIRTARPTNTVPSERTRKRRRAAMVEHVWSVGDRVDALIEDSWREGVVTEKNPQDESLLTVNFPARGEILVIPSALLHPSRVWKDGAWVEWSSSTASCRPSHGGDTPKEKRARVRTPVPEDKGKEDKASGSESAMESEKSDDPKLLSLCTDEKQFNIGKSSRTGTIRMPRSGLQKEGSRGVIFGVPKPGKKRKFMEVSKHYVGDRSGQPSEAKDSLKLTKYLVPHGPVSRGWRSSKSETNEKQAGISRPEALRSGRSQNVSGRTVVGKDNPADAENSSEEQDEMTFQPPYSSSSGAPERPVMSFSARAPATNAKPERASKGRLAPASARLQNPEDAKTLNSSSAGSASDSMEPRRSNRRIQPTSRLLEGLQTSSLMVSKIPAISHDRSNRSKNTLRGNNQG